MRASRVRSPDTPSPVPQRASAPIQQQGSFREQIQKLKRDPLGLGGRNEHSPGMTKAQARSAELETGWSANGPSRVTNRSVPAQTCEGIPRGTDPSEDEPRGGDSNDVPPLVENWCDPMARALLHWASPPGGAAHVVPVPAGVPPSTLDRIAAQLVRKIGVGQSSVHLQLGAGRLEGGEVLVQSGADGLYVHVTAPDGVDGVKLKHAIQERLTKRGLRLARVVVD